MDPDAGFGPAAGDVFFANERVGRSTLSHNYERYLRDLKALVEFWKFPESPRRITDLGGGAGVVPMYLAHRHPAAQVVVYDWAEGPLAMGRRLAEARGINNIEFRKASYDDLATGSVAGVDASDVVLLYYGLPLDAEYPLGVEPFLDREVFENAGVSPGAQMRSAATAVARLLADDGIAVICGNWTPWGAATFFDALRQAGLGIDWTRTFLEGDVRDNMFQPRVGYAFVRRDRPNLTMNSWEDAQAFFASGELKDSKAAYSIGASEAIASLFEGGRELMVTEAAWQTGGEERVRLVYRSGLVLLEHTSTMGVRRVCFNSVAAVRVMVERAMGVVAGWEQAGTAEVRRRELDPAFQPVAEALNVPGMIRGDFSPGT